MRSLSKVAPLAYLGFVCGCVAGENSLPGVTVTDSAGIEILESNSPAWGDGEGWHVVEPPLLEIGVTDGDDAYQLFQVRGVARLSDGRIAVVNEGSQEIRIYDRSGVHLTSLGGQGNGPGEFANLAFAAVLSGDSILAYNRVPIRVALFGPDGNLVRTNQIPYPAETGFMDLEPIELLANGLLLMYRTPDPFSTDFTDGLNRFPIALRTLDPWTGELDTLGSLPGTDLMIWHTDGGHRIAMLPFGRSSDVSALENNVFTTDNSDHSVQMLSSAGSLAGIIRTRGVVRNVGHEDIELYLNDLLDRYSQSDENQLREMRRNVLEMPIPETFPPCWGLEVDALGNIWMSEYTWPPDDSPRYTIFSSQGRLLGEVTLPRGLKREAMSIADPALEIGADFVLGVWVDEDGVESVRMYELDKPLH